MWKLTVGHFRYEVLFCLGDDKFFFFWLILLFRGNIILWNSQVQSSLSLHTDHVCCINNVDFCTTEPCLFASASDDMTVRVWHVAMEKSTANVCAPAACLYVKWNPIYENQFAFACADSKVYSYDIRNIKHPLSSFMCHRRPSLAIEWIGCGLWCCHFLSSQYFLRCRRNSLITQSLDETIKLWEVHSGRTVVDLFAHFSMNLFLPKGVISSTPTRTYSGHAQINNCVGLSCDGEYLVSGSEVAFRDWTLIFYHFDWDLFLFLSG